MGLDITVCRCHTEKCPHCGKPIKGTIRGYEYSAGYDWKRFLEKIGYYAPYGIRKIEPERDFYGKDMTLTSEQAKDLAEFVRVYRPYQWVSIGWLVDRATENGDFVVINADW